MTPFSYAYRPTILFAACAAALLWLGASSAHASLVLQLQASNYNQSTGTWTATVGSNATQATAANRPTLVSSLTPNGYSAVRFDGNDRLGITVPIPSGTPYTAFVFLRPNDIAGTGGGTIFAGAAGSFHYRMSNEKQSAVRMNQAALGDGTATLSTTAFSSINATVSPSGGTYRLNGAAVGTNAASSFTSTIGSIGSHIQDVPGEFFSGDIAEIRIYNTVLTDLERAAVESEFNAAYVPSYTLPPSAFDTVRDYGTTWWSGGSRGSAVWYVKTSRYAMTFDSAALSLTSIFPLEETLPETTALDQPQSETFPASVPSSSLSATLTASGSSVVIQPAATNTDNTNLLNSGKFYQRRWVKIKTNSGPALNTLKSGYEVIAWPDRVSIICRVVPTSSVTEGSLTLTLNLNSIFNELSSSGVAQALAASDGSGYVVLKSAGSNSITVDPSNSRVTIETNAGTWSTGQERTVGLVIYPSNNVAQTLPAAAQTESGALVVTAAQTATRNGDSGYASITPSYKLDYGYYEIPIPTNTSVSPPDSDRIERNRVTIQNPTSSPQIARLAFTKGTFAYQAGISCFLRDMDGNPLGIPVQLSKNWHTTNPTHRWSGSWFNGMTLLTIPPNATLQFEAVVLGQNYAGVPAASHAQLCLVGWSATKGSHQWDESAIGCWGENLVYDPDSAMKSAIGTDSRPMFLLGDFGTQKKWTGNYGGCDFLRYNDGGNTRRFQKRIRSQYQRYGPNLTDVTYAGETDNSLIDFKYSTSIYRSNDYVRGRHKIRYQAKNDATFSRMVFFQMASDNYNFNPGTAHAYGYAGDLAPTGEWTSGGFSTPVALTGALPWFSTLNCPVDTNVYSTTGAQRGFIIRSWNARINGQDNVPPYFVASGSRVDLVPPPGVTALKAGDYIEAEIERVYFGQDASAYYGGDDHFQTALQTYGNQHQMVMREAIGNDLSVNVTTGTLEKSYPVQIQATNNTAAFSITGGIGYVPVTLTGLTDYRSPLLEEYSGGAWGALDATTSGSNAWQADYEPESGTWQLTINVRLDDAAYQDITAMRDSAVTRIFRFRPAAAPSDVGLSATSISENNSANATVGTLAALDAGAAHTFSLVAGTGDTDNAAFTIAGSSLKLTPIADFETKSSYAIRIRATDNGVPATLLDKQFTISITDANDAPTFAGYSISTAYQKTASISLGKLTNKAADVEGDALSVTTAGPASAQGGTAVLQASSILYTPPTGFSGADTFPVTIADARGASVSGTVAVNVQVNTGIGTNAAALSVMSGGRIGVGFQGIPGRSYEIQRSSNLNDWTAIATVTAAANGAVTFIDESPPSGRTFYRLRKP